MKDDLEQLKDLLNTLQWENIKLRKDIEVYGRAIKHTAEELGDWRDKWEETNTELLELRNYLDDLRQKWNKEWEGEFE
jgi:chromosome segregation ATPase